MSRGTGVIVDKNLLRAIDLAMAGQWNAAQGRGSDRNLFYSKERRAILVQFDESKDSGAQARSRCYWLELVADYALQPVELWLPRTRR